MLSSCYHVVLYFRFGGHHIGYSTSSYKLRDFFSLHWLVHPIKICLTVWIVRQSRPQTEVQCITGLASAIFDMSFPILRYVIYFSFIVLPVPKNYICLALWLSYPKAEKHCISGSAAAILDILLPCKWYVTPFHSIDQTIPENIMPCRWTRLAILFTRWDMCTSWDAAAIIHACLNDTSYNPPPLFSIASNIGVKPSECFHYRVCQQRQVCTYGLVTAILDLRRPVSPDETINI